MIETIKSQYLITGGTMPLSGSSNHVTGALSVGVYNFVSDCAFQISQGPASLLATLTSSYPINATEEVVIVVTDATSNGYISGITNGMSGNLYYKIREIT